MAPLSLKIAHGVLTPRSQVDIKSPESARIGYFYVCRELVYRHVDAAAPARSAAASTTSSSAGSAAAAAVPPVLAEVPADFGVTVVSGGLTNILVRCTLPGKPPLLVRVFGANTDEV